MNPKQRDCPVLLSTIKSTFSNSPYLLNSSRRSSDLVPEESPNTPTTLEGSALGGVLSLPRPRLGDLLLLLLRLRVSLRLGGERLDLLRLLLRDRLLLLDREDLLGLLLLLLLRLRLLLLLRGLLLLECSARLSPFWGSWPWT